MPSKATFKNNFEIEEDNTNDELIVRHDNGTEYTFTSDGTLKTATISNDSGVDFEFDSTASTASFVDADTGNDLFVVNSGGDINIPGGELSVQGNTVATQTWANSNLASSGHSHDKYSTNTELSNHEDAGNPHSESASENVGVENPVYSSTSDVPSSIEKGETVFIDGDGLYVEDGT